MEAVADESGHEISTVPAELTATRGFLVPGRPRVGAAETSFDDAYSEMRAIYAALEKEEPQRNAGRTVMLFRLTDTTERARRRCSTTHDAPVRVFTRALGVQGRSARSLDIRPRADSSSFDRRDRDIRTGASWHASVADPNRALFESVVQILDPVLGPTRVCWRLHDGLMITDPAASDIRPTKDVDAIVDVTSYAKYAALSERLLALGLNEDTTNGVPLCRWRHSDLIVDVMPIDEDVLGSAAVGTRLRSKTRRRCRSLAITSES